MWFVNVFVLTMLRFYFPNGANNEFRYLVTSSVVVPIFGIIGLSVNSLRPSPLCSLFTFDVQ